MLGMPFTFLALSYSRFASTSPQSQWPAIAISFCVHPLEKAFFSQGGDDDDPGKSLRGSARSHSPGVMMMTILHPGKLFVCPAN